MPSPWLEVACKLDRSGTPFDATGRRTYHQVWQVVTTNKWMGPIAAAFAPGTPLPFAPYISGNGVEYDLFALCVRKQAKAVTGDNADWSQWEVEVDYDTQMPEGGKPSEFGSPGGGDYGGTGGQGQQGSSNNPELEPPDIEWDFEVVNKPKQRDLDKLPFTNSANQPFTPAPTFEVCYPVLVYTRNELDFNRARAAKYCFAVNSTNFLGAAENTVLCLPPKAKKMFRGPYNYWRTSYRFKFAPLKDDGLPESWQPEILDQGLCELQKVAGRPFHMKPVPITRGTGIPITQPVLLDGTGEVQEPFQIGGVWHPPTPVYIKRRVYRAEDLNALLMSGLGGP